MTLLRGSKGNPNNIEITFEVSTTKEAEQLHQAFIDAGSKGSPPWNQLMDTPVCFCPVIDPYGTDILIISQLDTGH